MEAFLTSLARVRDAGYRKLLPAHGPPLPGKAVAAVIAHRLEREDKIAAQLSAEWSELPAIARAAYDDVPEVPAPLAETQALAHLLRLARNGRAERDEDGRWRATASRS